MIFSEIRREKGFTQQTLADKLGVKQTCVAMWEKGKSLPRTERLMQLSDILGVDIATLIKSLTPNAPKGEEDLNANQEIN